MDNFGKVTVTFGLELQAVFSTFVAKQLQVSSLELWH